METQKQVDEKFLTDMRKLCVTQLSEEMNEDDPEYHLALHDCQTYGGIFHVGAETRYDGVRDVGTVFYKIRPNLTGSWLANPPAWTIVQDGRSVQVSWTGGAGHSGLSGTFDGTLISHDEGSVVMGNLSITEGNLHVTGTMTFQIVNGDTLDMSYQQSNGIQGTGEFHRQ